MDLRIPSDFFQAEDREGFHVSEEMKRCWAAGMKVLSMVGEVLDHHGLRWYADCGTLLGAVRHRGFVPWDDDIDIIMPRDDYQRAWSILRRELPSYFNVRCTQLNPWQNEPWGSVVNREHDDFGDSEEAAIITAEFYGSPYRHAIDIFSLDYVPPDGEERDVLSTLYIEIQEALDNYKLLEQGGLLDEMAQMLEEATGQTLPRDPRELRKALWGLNDAFASMYSREDAGGVDITYFWAYSKRHPRPIAAYDHTVWLPFEMLSLPAPAGYAEVLRISYGDRWCVPVKQSVCHEYPYFGTAAKGLQEIIYRQMVERAEALEAEGQFTEERELLQKGLEQFPNRYPFHYLMARALLAEDPGAAEKYLKKAVELCDNEEHRTVLAESLQQLQEALR